MEPSTQASLTSGRIGTLVLVLVTMTGAGAPPGAIITAPWEEGRDLQQQQ